MGCQTTRAAISRRVARMPAWASSWIALKTSRWSATGMRGLGCPVEVSQITLSPCMSMCCSCKEEEWAAFSVSWHDFWFAAILAKSRLTGTRRAASGSRRKGGRGQSGQRVCHDVFRTRYMTDICCELGHVGELS